MGYSSYVVLGGDWVMVQVNSPHPQITHKSTIPSCPPSTELTYSHVALILVPLNTGSPSIPPSFHNIQAISTSKHHELSKPSKNRAEAENSAQNTNQYHNFSYSNTPVTFPLFQFVHRWIGSKILLEVPST